MRTSCVLVPIATLLAGILGYFFRMAELEIIFDSVTGLPERGAPITVVLIGLSVLLFVVFTIFAIRTSVKYTIGADYDNAFGTDTFAYPVVFTAVGTVWLIATFVYFLGILAAQNGEFSDRIFAIGSALAALALIIFAIEVYKNPRRKFLSLFSIMPSLFMCFWLIIIYRDNASNPVLLSYTYKVLAIVFSAAGCYFSSSFATGKPVIGKAIVSYSLAAYFCIITLADDYPMSMRLILGAIAFLNIFNLGSLLRNLQRKIKKKKRKKQQGNRQQELKSVKTS